MRHLHDRGANESRAGDSVPATPVHGGDLEAIGRRYGLDPRELLDFSANLNPLGPPPTLLCELARAASDVRDLARYPEPTSRALREALARSLEIDAESIVVGNGAAALFAVALVALGARACAVATPAFSEYHHAVRTANAVWHGIALDPARDFAFDPIRALATIRTARANVAIVTNPHNPSGALASRETLLAFAAEARALGAATIVDEAFIDYVAAGSLARDAAAADAPSMPALVVIRSLTKFYAVPALRVGYAIAAPELARRMRAELPSWPVTTLASRALVATLEDPDHDIYARRTLDANARAKARLVADLARIGIDPLPSAANFLLVRLPHDYPRAADLVRRLIVEAGIVVRDCSSYDGLEGGDYVRIAIRSESENARLIAALAPYRIRTGATDSREGHDVAQADVS